MIFFLKQRFLHVDLICLAAGTCFWHVIVKSKSFIQAPSNFYTAKPTMVAMIARRITQRSVDRRVELVSPCDTGIYGGEMRHTSTTWHCSVATQMTMMLVFE